MRLIVLSVLAAMAVGAVTSAPASATTRVYRNCWLVGSPKGGFDSSQCNKEEPGGHWARTYFTTGGQFQWCEFVGLNLGVFSDGNCRTIGGFKQYRFLTGTDVVLIKGGTYTLKSKLAGVAATIVCKKMKAKNPLIIGGEPGRSEAEALEYTECSSEKPAQCVVNSLGAPAGTIDTEPLDAELVENAAKTEIENLFLPKSGTKFVGILYSNKGTENCALKGNEFPVEGTSLTLIDPQETESEEQLLLSEPASSAYLNSKGESKTAELTLGGNPATLSGTASVLVDIEGKSEPFGVY
jgi:hypothetical protein